MGRKLEAAIQELARARDAATAMNEAASIEAVDEAWKDCIGRLTRLWNKTEASLKGDPRFYNSPWVKEVQTARKNDPLIRYIAQARHADEHSHEGITHLQRGSVSINPPVPNGHLHIRNLRISGGRMTLDAPNGAWIAFEPSGVFPKPVKNRGHVYDVPTEHLGKPLPQGSTLIDFATLGVDFYDRIVRGLEGDGWDKDQ